MNRFVYSGAILFLMGCDPGVGAGAQPEVGSVSDAETIGVTLNGPPSGIDCISFTLEKENGGVQNVQFSLTGPRTVRIRNVGVGAYELSAVAYSSGLTPPITDAACASVPSNSPWSTEEPIPVVVQSGRATQVNLTLVPTGRIVVTPTFLQPPEVVASNQGPVSFIAAAGTFVSWVVKKQDTVLGSVMGFNDGAGPPPFVITGNQSNPAQLLIDPATNTVFWENTPSLQTDADGNFINDGSIWSSTGGELRTGLDPTDLGFASANNTFYWGERSSNSIECVPCSASFATGEPQANTLTAIGNHVLWSNSVAFEELLRARDVTDPSAHTLASVGGTSPYGMTADDQFLYYVSAPSQGDFNDSTISKVPLAGGTITSLVEHTALAFPISAFKGFVYYLDANGVHRVSVDAGAPEDVVKGSIGGFALTTDAQAHDVMYWTDTTHGGLVWRGRVN